MVIEKTPEAGLILNNQPFFDSRARTNFIFQVQFNKERRPEISRLSSRLAIETTLLPQNLLLKEIERLGGRTTFLRIESRTLHLNIEMIDSALPHILADDIHEFPDWRFPNKGLDSSV